MLRKYATESRKDWDKLLPYMLLAYHEVPQAPTGLSLFELLYGHPVWGSLDILKEEWEAGDKSDKSVVSLWVLSLWDRLESMYRKTWVRPKGNRKPGKTRTHETGPSKPGTKFLSCCLFQPIN